MEKKKIIWKSKCVVFTLSEYVLISLLSLSTSSHLFLICGHQMNSTNEIFSSVLEAAFHIQWWRSYFKVIFLLEMNKKSIWVDPCLSVRLIINIPRFVFVFNLPFTSRCLWWTFLCCLCCESDVTRHTSMSKSRTALLFWRVTQMIDWLTIKKSMFHCCHVEAIKAQLETFQQVLISTECFCWEDFKVCVSQCFRSVKLGGLFSFPWFSFNNSEFLGKVSLLSKQSVN